MRFSRSAFVADVAFLSFLLLTFMTIMIFANEPDDPGFCVIAAAVIFAVSFITHFTSVTTGLVINVVLIFGYLTHLIYGTVMLGAANGMQEYIWIILLPPMTISSSLLFREGHNLEKKNQELERKTQKFTGWDERTGLKTYAAYEQDMLFYRNIAKRNNLESLLIVWKFRYENEMKRYLSRDELEEVVVQISLAMQDVFRDEDALYILSSDPYMWGTLTILKADSERIILNRMKAKINDIDLKEVVGKRAPRLEMRIGSHYCLSSEETAGEILEKAVLDMQYDA